MPRRCKSPQPGGFQQGLHQFVPAEVGAVSTHVLLLVSHLPTLVLIPSKFSCLIVTLPKGGRRAAGRQGIRLAAGSLRSTVSLRHTLDHGWMLCRAEGRPVASEQPGLRKDPFSRKSKEILEGRSE